MVEGVVDSGSSFVKGISGMAGAGDVEWEKKERMSMGEMKKRDELSLKGKDLVEWRRQQVAQGLLAHKTVRQIQAELARLAAQGLG